jgi:Leucine-rich repeat (LRR) protein
MHSETVPTPPKRTRRWLSFSLRSLFVVTLVIACLLGWKVHTVQRQRRAVSKIEEAGGTVHYRSDPPFGVSALKESGFFDYVVAVRLIGRDVEDVSYLADLPTIEDLNLSGTKVTDLSPLANLTRLKRLLLLAAPVRDVSPLSDLTRLESLSLENTQVADVSPLARLLNLRDLSLAGTPVGDLSALAGMSLLTELKLFFCPNVKNVDPLRELTMLSYLDLSDTMVSDVEPLTHLKSLGFLSLSRTAVPPSDTQKLRGQLPRCRITHNR